MFDPNSIPLGELLRNLNSFAVVILVGAAMLVLCEVAILLGAVIGNMEGGGQKPKGGRVSTR